MRGISDWVVLAFAIVLPACFAVSHSRAADMVPWVNDLATAQQMATARNQLILIHFYSNDCPPCRRLENNVFNRPGFGNGVARNYVPVRVNVSVSPDLARRFNVDRCPTDLLLTSRGEEIHRMVSPQDLNEYLRILNQVAWRVNSLPSGAPIQQASQGFRDDGPQSAAVGSGSPYQLVSQPVGQDAANPPPANGIQPANQQLPRYALNDSPAGINYGPAFMNSVGPNSAGDQVAANQHEFQPGVPHQNGTAQPSYAAAGAPPAGMNAANNLAQQQLAFAQQQVAMAQQHAESPQMIENRFAALPTAQPAPPIHALVGTTRQSPVQPSLNPARDVTQVTSSPRSASLGPATAATGQMLGGPALSAPNLSAPSLSAPSSSAPSLSAPSLSAANLSAPSLSAPSLSAAGWTPPAATTPAGPAAALQPSPPSAATPAVAEKGLEGFCPVTLIDQDRWVQGDKRWGARHRGRLYLFQSAAAQQKFLAAPDRYSPALAGFDPVVFAERGQYAEGQRTHGIRYQDQIFMFVSEESLSRFAEAPTRYTEIVRQAIGANRQLR